MKNARMIVFLVVLSSLCTLILTGAQIGYEKASSVFSVRLYRTILDLFDIPAAEGGVEEVFHENFDTAVIGDRTYYISKEKEKGSIVFRTVGAGLWSQIEVLLAVAPGRDSLYGFRVISQAETPGLGGRITEIEFQERFRGVRIRPALRVVKFAAQPNEVDAITGASVTSRSIEKIINSGIAEMDKAFEGR